jgi:hypothetical protein
LGSGKKRIVYVDTEPSTASGEVYINGALALTVASNSTGSASFISDGYDEVLLQADSAGSALFDYVYIKEVSEENLLLNGGFESDITSWVDDSSGAGTATWDSGKFAKLTRIDSSNRGALSQSVSGTRGKKNKYVVKNDSSSTGNVALFVNGVLELTLTPGDQLETVTTSDGLDGISIVASTDASTVYVDYVIQTLYTQYDETIDLLGSTGDNLLLNSYFLTDINSWVDISTGTGSIAWDNREYLKIIRIDSSNQGIVYQDVAGTSGVKQKYTIKNGAISTGDVQIYINSILMGNIAPGEDKIFIVTSDGADRISMRGVIDGTTVYVDYVTQGVYTEYENPLSTVVRTDLPDFKSGVLTVTLDKLFATVQLGELVIGEVFTFGSFRNANITMKSYATKTTDVDTGVTTLTGGDYSRILDYRVGIEESNVEASLQTIEDNGNIAIVAVGDVDYPQTIVYGFIAGFSAYLDGLVKNDFSIKIEELT